MRLAAAIRAPNLPALTVGDYHVALSAGVPTAIDEIRCRSQKVAKWEVTFVRSDGECCHYNVTGLHNGTLSVDATVSRCIVNGGVMTSVNGGLVAFDVGLVGSGASQLLQLIVQAPTSAWVASVSRGPILGQVPA